MKLSSFLYMSKFGLKTVFFKKKDPLLGSVIITDRCNLHCKHCSVNNITGKIHPFSQIKEEMQTLYDMGVRILFLYGGEPFLWKDGDKDLKSLVSEAKKMGFMSVIPVTNGTYSIDLPEADMILLSFDGDKEHHNAIRGDTYDKIMENINNSNNPNICLYMAINKMNMSTIRYVCQVARETKNVKAVSFNFHTPYPDTTELQLTVDEKRECCDIIVDEMKKGTPVFNLKTAFPYIITNNFKAPCDQYVIIENGKLSVCGRCGEIPGLCEQCGFFYVAEYSLVFGGNWKVIFDMLRTYFKYI